MIKYYTKTVFLILAIIFSNQVYSQGIPDLLYYRFDDTGRTVRNLATNPPPNTKTATIYGNLTQGSNGACGGTALVGTAGAAGSEYVDTHWVDTLRTTAWTFSFWLKEGDSSKTQCFLFSEASTPIYCYSGGSAGAGNIYFSCPGGSIILPKSSGKLPHVCTIVVEDSKYTITGYVDGKVAASSTVGSCWLVSGGFSLLISGRLASTLPGLPKGALIDEFRFYGRTLSANEIAKLRYNGSTNTTTVLCGITSYKSPSGKYTWTKPGTYYDTLTTMGNCDSIMKFIFTGSDHSKGSMSVTACDFYVSPSKKFTWRKSGVYTDVIPNKGGCDSVLTINLTVKFNSARTINETSCNSFISPSGKYIWTKTGKYSDTLKRSNGCDSFLYYNLTIGNTTFDTLHLNECNSFKSPSKRFTWFKSGIYKDTLLSHLGCDSILVINLVINHSSNGGLNPTACNTYKSPSGKKIWVKSGLYVDTLGNKLGCDSIISINLTIKKSSIFQLSTSSCYKFISPSGKYSVTASTSFYDTIRNAAGCDSIMLLNVKIIAGSQAQITPKFVNTMSVPAKKYIWKVSGKYSDTVLNRQGCDSVITIDLTVNAVNVGVSQNYNKLSALANGVSYQWLDCDKKDAKIPGAIFQQYTATALGNYSVEINDGQCTDTSTCYAVTSLNIPRVNISQYLSVFPNPASGRFTLTSRKPLNEAYFTVTNAFGETVLHKSYVNGNSFLVDISNYSNGIYFLEICNNQSSGRIKLFKLE